MERGRISTLLGNHRPRPIWAALLILVFLCPQASGNSQTLAESDRMLASLAGAALRVHPTLEIGRARSAPIDTTRYDEGVQRASLPTMPADPARPPGRTVARATPLQSWGALVPIALLAAGSLVGLARARAWGRTLPLTRYWLHTTASAPARSPDMAPRKHAGSGLDDRLLGQLAGATLDGVLILDDEGRVLHANALAVAILGAGDSHDLCGVDLYDWLTRRLAPLDRPETMDRMASAFSAGTHKDGVWQLDGTRPNGDGFTAEVAISALRLNDRWGAIAMVRDVTERVRLERRVSESCDGFRRVVEESPTGILILDPGGNELYANRAAQAFLATAPGRAVSVPFASPGQSAARSEIRVQRADGSRGVVSLSVTEIGWQGAPALLAMLDDITERKSDEERMRRLAFQDTLTGLPNRGGFLDHLRRITRSAPEQTDAFALLFMDLDRFKTINDTLGHAVGDNLLAAVASRLSNLVRGADCVARIGGDEFTAIISGVRTPKDVEAVTRKFRGAFRDPFAFQDRTLYMTASIGVALYPSDGRDPDLLLRHADTAMYDAKSRGAGLFSLYRPEMSEETLSRLELEAALHRAVNRGELVLHYQPQVRLADRAVIGAEALLRWRHPERGLLAPDLFVPLLEDTGLIVEVGEWVLESACAQALSWRQKGEHAPPVSINVSPIQVDRGGLAESVQRLIRNRGFQRGLLHLELTETAMFRNMEHSVELLNSLVALGVHLAIDDFGTGHSSLGMVRRLPVSTIKLDREFIRGIAEHSADQALAKATIAMAHGLGKTVIAEGVETDEQVRVLLALGCDAAQGRYFGGPVPPDELRF